MAEEGDLLINGKVYNPDTLTFREQREMKRILREDMFDGDLPEDIGMADTTPAMVLVLVHRDNPKYTLDEALDLVPAEILLTKEAAAKLNKRPPTQAAKKSTSGDAGPPS